MSFFGKIVVYVFSSCILFLLDRYRAFKIPVMYLTSMSSFHQSEIEVRVSFL